MRANSGILSAPNKRSTTKKTTRISPKEIPKRNVTISPFLVKDIKKFPGPVHRNPGNK
jgi:hypothetical protein